MSSNMLIKHKETLADLLYLDTWRGRDSTGVAAVRHNADTHVLKATIPGYEFVEGNKLADHLRLNDFLWIGHNRFGTVGRNTKTNAHPFMIDDHEGSCLIVGAHNGTLKSKHTLIDHAKFGTDSEALYNNIAVEGIEKTLLKTEGAWALTYYDHVEEEFRFIRNKERPFFYAFEKGRKALIWASEAWMIKISCSRHGIELEEDKVISANEDTLYRVPVPLKNNEELVLHRKGGVAGKAQAFFQRQHWTGGRNGHTQPQATETTPQQATGPTNPLGFHTTQAMPTTRSVSPSGTTPPNSGARLPAMNVPLSGNVSSGRSAEEVAAAVRAAASNVTSITRTGVYKGFNGILISKKELQDQLDGGCGWCEKEFITIEDKGYGWLAEGKPICRKCMVGEHEDQAMINAIFNQTGDKVSIQ